MLSQKDIIRIHNSVCAIGVLPLPLKEWRQNPLHQPLRVHGSGFLIRSNIVMTNKHVLDSVKAHAEEFELPESQLFVSFIAPDPTSMQIGTVRMIRHNYSPQNGDLDVALLEIKLEPKIHFEGIFPLDIAESPEVIVSEEVVICGYPYGNMLLEPEGKPYRFGPIIQQGFVSGLAPYAGSPTPEEILLDVRTAGGMSGSPVVRTSTLDVIGIHYEAVLDRTAITTTSFAIPLYRNRVSYWLDEFDEILMNHSRT